MIEEIDTALIAPEEGMLDGAPTPTEAQYLDVDLRSDEDAEEEG